MAGKRGQNEGSIFKRTDGRWCAQVNLGYVNGKRKRKYFYGETRREVQEQLTSTLRDVQQGNPVTTERLSVGQYLDRWMEDSVRPTVSPRSYVTYRQIVRNHFIPAFGRVSLAKLTAHRVQVYLNAELAAGRSPRTVAHGLGVLRIALNQAVRWNLVARNVALLVLPPRAPRYEVRPLTPDQARVFLDVIKGDRLEALYTVAVAVGMRQGEIFGLQWQDIDLDEGTLTVRHQLQRIDGKAQLVEPKSVRSRRVVALPAVAVTALRRHQARQTEERLVAGSSWQEWGLVFASKIGTPLTKNLTATFQRLLRDAGLPRQRFHDLRHTCASLLLAQGVHPRLVMETLGHSQIGVTMNTYSHVIPALRRSVADEMEALLTGPK